MEGPLWEGGQTAVKVAQNTRNRNAYGALSLSWQSMYQLKNEERQTSCNENEKQAFSNLLRQGDSAVDVSEGTYKFGPPRAPNMRAVL
jgi:hypothetical protein